MHVQRTSPVRPLVASRPPAVAVAAKALAPATAARMVALAERAQALGANGLPDFNQPGEYKIYAIRAVGYTRYAEAQLAGAKADLAAGKGSERAVDEAAYELNAARTELRKIQRSVGGFKKLIWKFFKGFNIDKFWAEQQVDSRLMIVKPPAPEPITALKSPAIDAANAALAAVGKGSWDAAESGFTQAVKLASSPKEAQLIGEAASKVRFHISANYAYTRGAQLATLKDQALDIAAQAGKSKAYRYDATEFAFKRAADLSKTRAEASDVAAKATEAGYADAASYAANKALTLP